MKTLQERRPLARALFGFAASALLASGLTAQPAAFVDDEDEAEDEWFAVVGGDVYTGTGEVLRGATLLAKNGIIEEIGYELWIPEEAEVLDAHGLRVYPGLVALDASSRLSSGGFLDAGPPGDHRHQAFGAEANLGDSGSSSSEERTAPRAADESGGTDRAPAMPQRTALEDGFDPFNSYLVLALATGITTAEQSSAAVKLKRGSIDNIELRSRYLSSLSYSTRNPSGMAELRSQFRQARDYMRALREWKELDDDEVDEPSKRGIKSNLIDIMEGRTRALFRADSRTDLLNIARLAQEFNFRPVIDGGTEAWVVASELGRAGSAAIVKPRTRRDRAENLVREGGSSIENAAILHERGVQVAISPSSGNIDLGGITGRDLMHLPIEAGFAVRGGLSEAAALAGITIVPARLLGVDDRVGSLEVGKHCDLIVTDGDVLHYQTFVQWTVVEGDIVYDKSEENYFAHIRPLPEDHDESEDGEGHGEDHEGEHEEGEHEEGDDD